MTATDARPARAAPSDVADAPPDEADGTPVPERTTAVGAPAGTSGLRRISAAPPRRGRRVPDVVLQVVPPLVVFALAIGVWLAFSYVLLDERRRFLLPPPHDVFAEGILDAENRTEILWGLWSTTKVAMTGLGVAIVIGLGAAVAMSQARWVERSLYPYAVLLQTIPVLALVPVVGFWWGFNFRSRVTVCVIMALFPIITNTLFGLRSADPGLHDLFTMHRVGRWRRLVRLQLPNALPAVFTGLRISAGLSVIGAIVGDFFFRQGEPGIGRLLDIYRADMASELLYTAVFLSSALGFAVFVLFGVLGNRLTHHWHESGMQHT